MILSDVLTLSRFEANVDGAVQIVLGVVVKGDCFEHHHVTICLLAHFGEHLNLILARFAVVLHQFDLLDFTVNFAGKSTVPDEVVPSCFKIFNKLFQL